MQEICTSEHKVGAFRYGGVVAVDEQHADAVEDDDDDDYGDDGVSTRWVDVHSSVNRSKVGSV